jgi:hypothetical protein
VALSRVEILQENEKDRPAWEDIRHVIALEPGLKTWVKGVILDLIGDLKISLLCEDCGSELKFAENQLTCENCHLPRSGRIVLSTAMRLDDGTGVVLVRLVRADASRLSIFDRQMVESQMLKGNVLEVEPSEEQKLNLTGKEVELYGTAKPSSGNGKVEFIADRVILASSP